LFGAKNLTGPTGEKHFSVGYKDAEDEFINVSDDEDLATAYDVASNELKGNLKLHVAFQEGASVELPDEKEPPSKKEEVKEDPVVLDEKMVEDSAPLIEEVAAQLEEVNIEECCPPIKEEEECCPPKKEEEKSCPPKKEEGEQIDTGKKKKCGGKKAGCGGKREKKGKCLMGENKPLPPRKIMKGLIQKELERQAP